MTNKKPDRYPFSVPDLLYSRPYFLYKLLSILVISAKAQQPPARPLSLNWAHAHGSLVSPVEGIWKLLIGLPLKEPQGVFACRVPE